MAKFEHLSKEKLDDVISELWKIESSLMGMGALFQTKDTPGDISMNGDEFFGIGYVLKKFSKDLSVIQDILGCGHDSMERTEESFKDKDEC